MKILILGSNGMAGHIMTRYLKEKGFNVSTLARNNADFCVDIENQNQLDNFLNSKNSTCDFLINCIGLLVGDANKNPARASYINSYFPHYLEQKYSSSLTRIVHLSTDCVFDGTKGNYVESDIHTEMNYYGKSKSLGEITNIKDITFRMSIIGPELKSNGTGLLHWILTNTDKELNGWENVWWNGITTLQLAKCIEKYVQNPIISGVYNLVNNDLKINKYDLLCKINNIYKLKKTINKIQGPKSINKVLIDTRKLMNFEIPDYDTMLEELKEYTYSGSYSFIGPM
jgi:dTDP-4-dehydrorhamnose reductase